MFVPNQSYIPNLTVQRAPHKANFTVVQNQLMDDKGLSPFARLIAHHIISKPDGWKVIPKNIAVVLNRHVDTIYKYLRELVEYGLLTRCKVKNKFGQWSGYSYVLIEPTEIGGNPHSKTDAEPNNSVQEKTVTSQTIHGKTCSLINTEVNKYQDKKLDLSPTSLTLELEERDLWDSNLSDPEVIESPIRQQIEAIEATSTALVSREGECSAASYKKPTLATTKNKQKQAVQSSGTWFERGQENGLWQSKKELDSFMVALHTHAANNPRLTLKGKWVESEIEKTCTNGTGTHWVEYQAGLNIGTIDKLPWSDADGNINLSFRSYVEQSKFGEAGNSTARAVELAAQVFACPAKATLLWNEYQRRLERELEEKAKCDRLGIVYDTPGILKPKYEISTDRTAETQELLQVNAAPQLIQPILSPTTQSTLEAESSHDFDNIDWESITIESEVKLKMLALGINMNISKPKPEITPLSEIYKEPKSIDRTEIDRFNIWLDLAKAQRLVSYGYSDAGVLIVVRADENSAISWQDARSLFGDFK
jgi:hypothetical protein